MLTHLALLLESKNCGGVLYFINVYFNQLEKVQWKPVLRRPLGGGKYFHYRYKLYSIYENLFLDGSYIRNVLVLGIRITGIHCISFIYFCLIVY